MSGSPLIVSLEQQLNTALADLETERQRVRSAEAKVRVTQRALAKAEAAEASLAGRLDELETENLTLRGIGVT